VDADDERRYVEFVAGRLGWLRKVAYLLCQDWHAADDLAQATITRLYVHWGRAVRADNLDGYARRVLVREFLGERRTAWATRVRLQTGPVAEVGATDADPETRMAVSGSAGDRLA
jgi:DNA-directed RNA polymerase specialized sigma24 family protein